MSSPSDRHRRGITSPFLNPFQKKRGRSDPRSVPEEHESPIYTHRPSRRYSTCWHVNWLVCETVVCLNTWCLETLVLLFLAACDNNSRKQQCVWVLLKVSAQLYRRHDSCNCTKHLEVESDLSHKLSGPKADSTSHCCWILCSCYLKVQSPDSLRSQYRLMWCLVLM